LFVHYPPQVSQVGSCSEYCYFHIHSSCYQHILLKLKWNSQE
jgi:hypothetical protein